MLTLLGLCSCWLLSVQAASQYKSAVVLKLPRSGSSWFVSLLSQQPNVWIVPQVVRPDAADEQSDAYALEMIMAALTQPFKARDDPIANSETQRVIGFSINPLKSAGESRFNNGSALRDVVSKRDSWSVLFERTNLVKATLATLRGACLKEQCHFNNAVTNREKWPKSHVLLNGLNSDADFQNCAIAPRQRVPVRDFQCTLYWHAAARQSLRQLHSLIASPKRQIYVAYEALQRNVSDVVARVFAADQLGPLDKPLQLEQFFTKTTGENLKESIVNYGELFELFQESRAVCLLEMLQVDHPRVFNTTDCVIPPSWAKACKGWLDAPKPQTADQCVLEFP